MNGTGICRKKILWISSDFPDDNRAQAGSQTFNYYIKGVSKTNLFDITVLICDNASISTDADQNEIKTIQIHENRGLLRRIINIESHLNPLNKYGNLIRNGIALDFKYYLLKNRAKLNPDLIILEWTQKVILSSEITKIFPNIPIIASEHDVTYLRYFRLYKNENNIFKRTFKKIKYINLKRRELQSLENCELVKTHNIKDARLLINDGVNKNKISPLVAYYHDYSNVSSTLDCYNIMFYGAMGRDDNYKCALWIIDNIMPSLPEYHLFVVGGNPPKELKDRESKNITITGFVNDVSIYFQNSFCFIAPLKTGAGIKVKVLEAMSAGIPVLTNDIGIEGIPAINQISYIKCDSADDYIQNIIMLRKDIMKAKYIRDNARIMLNNNFNLDNSLKSYIDEIINITDN
jgi:glycosyltransferase involved in cell wall biosynthesis